jgi:hypothetical protein
MKKLLIIFSVFLFTSCASFQFGTVAVTYDFNQYDYNSIHYLYTNNPHYFYNNSYIDQFGIMRYYYSHPYFVRYYTYRNIKPNHNYYIKTRRDYVRNKTHRGERPTR